MFKGRPVSVVASSQRRFCFRGERRLLRQSLS